MLLKNCDYVVKTSQTFHVWIDQNDPKVFNSWFDGKPAKKYFSAIGQHLVDNHECASYYIEETFLVLIRAE